MVDKGILGFLPMLHSGDTQTRVEAVYALEKLLDGPVDIVDTVVKADAIEALVAIVSGRHGYCKSFEHDDGVFEAGTCLETLTKGRNDLKMAVVKAGALPMLIAGLDTNSGHCRITATHVLQHICD